MNSLEDAALNYQQALAQSERARRLASMAQEKADQFVRDADVAQRNAQEMARRLQEAGEHFGRDF